MSNKIFLLFIFSLLILAGCQKDLISLDDFSDEDISINDDSSAELYLKKEQNSLNMQIRLWQYEPSEGFPEKEDKDFQIAIHPNHRERLLEKLKEMKGQRQRRMLVPLLRAESIVPYHFDEPSRKFDYPNHHYSYLTIEKKDAIRTDDFIFVETYFYGKRLRISVTDKGLERLIASIEKTKDLANIYGNTVEVDIRDEPEKVNLVFWGVQENGDIIYY